MSGGARYLDGVEHEGDLRPKPRGRSARPRGGEAKKQESKAGHGFEAKTNFEATAW